MGFEGGTQLTHTVYRSGPTDYGWSLNMYVDFRVLQEKRRFKGRGSKEVYLL